MPKKPLTESIKENPAAFEPAAVKARKTTPRAAANAKRTATKFDDLWLCDIAVSFF